MARRMMVTPTSVKIAAIGACGLCTVTRTLATRGKRGQDRIGDRAGGGLDQAVVARGEGASVAVSTTCVA